MRKILLIGLAAAVAVAAVHVTVACRRRNPTAEQMRRLAAAMQWHRGEAIGEIGAGDGSMSMLAAEEVGPTGRVYANELDPALVEQIKATAAGRRLENVMVVQGSAASTNLPDNCCDAVFMHWVYHHFEKPAEMNASLFRAVRQGGLLVIADFSPGPVEWLSALVKRHAVDGVRPGALVCQVSAAGFSADGEVKGWPGKGYCLLFRRLGEKKTPGNSIARRRLFHPDLAGQMEKAALRAYLLP